MRTPKGIVWLSSYPKSGNTWFRIVLSRLINSSPQLDYINDIDMVLGSPMVTNRGWINTILGFNSMLLTDNEIDAIRPDVYRWHARQLDKTAYIKTHDAYIYLNDNTPLLPQEGCLGAIYFIRNPLDVAVSLANHAKCPLDWSIEMMGNEEFSVPLAMHREKQLRQTLLSWSSHVRSWTHANPLNVLVLRYEDMLANPVATFTTGMQFLNLQCSTEKVEEALAAGSFNTLQQREKQQGFKEKLAADGLFFRKGIAGDWKDTLNPAQTERIINDHSEVMRQYGYLDANLCPF